MLTIPLPVDIPEGAYVGYFENGNGEKFVLIREKDTAQTTLWRNQGGWHSYRVELIYDPSRPGWNMSTLPPLRVGDEDCHRFGNDEMQWMRGCWEALKPS